MTFRYKQDPQGERQYGLIAEEVARFYPELVSYGADGKVITVHYHELIPMLLNEIQKQAVEVRKQTRENQRQAEQVTELKANQEHQRVNFERRFAMLERALAAKASDGKLAAAFNR